jgi:preprotein translocase subunit YajC
VRLARLHGTGRAPEEVIVLGSLITPLAAGGSSSSGSGLGGILIFLVPMGLIFYFLIIRPQRRQRQARMELIDSIDVGDEVVTIGGVFGIVKAMDDESMTVEVAPGVDMRFAREAIARKRSYEQYDESEEPEEDEPVPTQDQDTEEEQQPKQDWRTGPRFGRGARRRGRGQEAGEQS